MTNLLRRAARTSQPEIDNVVEHAAGLRSLEDASRLLGIRPVDVLSLIDRGAFPDAYQADGHWRIPVADIQRVQLAREALPQETAAVLVRTREPYIEQREPGTWMTPAERRKFIAQRLTTQRSVKVTVLSAELGVSQMTIRRDLTRLETEGLLVRTYGGAIAPSGRARMLCAPRRSRELTP